jgi:glycosyltransferase involved in cell wall biosynthesis
MKKRVVVSAINFFEGGPLTVLKSCLAYLDNSDLNNEFTFIALVHDKSLFNEGYPNIELIEFPKSRKSYLYRLYYEYFYFKKWAIKKKIFFWFSLHDITPSLNKDIIQAVYCHNPSPFNSLNFKDIYLQPTQFFFKLFYKYLYRVNIHKNKFVIVQQLWLKNEFKKIFKLTEEKIIVATPNVVDIPDKLKSTGKKSTENIFFFPTFPRPFKNIDVICKAVTLLSKNGIKDFKVVITLDGTENKYSNYIFKKYRHLKNIQFSGILTKEQVYTIYNESDFLIFPSKLETWGLPITEFKQFDKPIITVNLPYALETVGDYNKACFFEPDNFSELSVLMEKAIKKQLAFKKTKIPFYGNLVTKNWKELFNYLLK